jgi:alpha-D-ribose 1-methylphosphonate 5-triphosphate diphosphatase
MGELVITGGDIVTPQGVVSKSTLVAKDGIIQEIGRTSDSLIASGQTANKVHVSGSYVLPGLISLHCCFLEKELFPRQGVEFPTDRAVIQADKVMASSGLVEAYHAVRINGEADSFSLKTAEAIASLQERGALLCSHRLHLIADSGNMAAARPFSGFDHILSVLAPGNHLYKDVKTQSSAMIWKPRSLTDEKFGFLSGFESRANFRTVFEVQPLGSLPLQAASNDFVVIAATHLVCSPSDKMAVQGIKKNLIDVLVADSYAPSLLYAVFLLDRLGLMPLHQAVTSASLTPARILGKEASEGSLELGKLANLIVVEVWEGIPRVIKTIVRGEVRFSVEGMSS